MKFGLKENTIEQIKSVFSKYSQVEIVILYGSRAKGNFKTGSDIDFTLKGKNLNNFLLYKIERDLDELYLPYSFGLSIFEHIDNFNLKVHIERTGKVFYKKKKGLRESEK